VPPAKRVTQQSAAPSPLVGKETVMLDAKDIVVWINDKTKEVMVKTRVGDALKVAVVLIVGTGVTQSERPIRNGGR
jgi:hypothetical protein